MTVKDKIDKYLNEETEPLFTIDNVEEVKRTLEKGINAPYVEVEYSTLGGEDRVSIVITISLDKKENWPYIIMQNSRFVLFHLYKNHVLEQTHKYHAISKKMRKSRPKTIKDVIKKINTYVNQIE